MRDWLPEGDLAYFIIDVAATLDLREIYQYYEFSRDSRRRKAARGQPPYDPEMMTALLLYGYCNGAPSSRRIVRRCRGGGQMENPEVWAMNPKRNSDGIPSRVSVQFL